MGWNQSPCALHHELHEESAQREHGNCVRICPERNHWNGENRGDHDGSAAADSLRPCAEQNPAQQRADVIDDCDQPYGLRGELVVFLKERRIEILRAVAERIKGEHQDNQKKKTAKVGDDVLREMSLRLARYPSLEPGGRFFDLGANVNHQERGQRSDHEHATPSYEREQGAIDQSGEKITHHITFLQQSGEETAAFGGQGFESQGCTDSPLSSHRDSEYSPHDQKEFGRRSEG